jgi:hypothetical protein
MGRRPLTLMFWLSWVFFAVVLKYDVFEEQ